MAREVGESGDRVRDDDLRDLGRHHVLDDGRDGATCDGSIDEQVPVGHLAGLGDEDPTRLDQPRVGVDAAAHQILSRGTGSQVELSVEDVGELSECEGNHRFSGRIGRRSKVGRAQPNLDSSVGAVVAGMTR